MSAWYVFNAIGLYPRVGIDEYYLSIPLFPLAKIHLPNDATLTIEAPHLTEDTTHIRQVLLNGEPLPGFTVRHADLSNATLTFIVG